MTPNLSTVRFLRRPQVEAMTGLSKSSIYSLKAEGRFPEPIVIGSRAVAWEEAEVQQWMQERKRFRSSVTSSSQ